MKCTQIFVKKKKVCIYYWEWIWKKMNKPGCIKVNFNKGPMIIADFFYSRKLKIRSMKKLLKSILGIIKRKFYVQDLWKKFCFFIPLTFKERNFIKTKLTKSFKKHHYNPSKHRDWYKNCRIDLSTYSYKLPLYLTHELLYLWCSEKSFL